MEKANSDRVVIAFSGGKVAGKFDYYRTMSDLEESVILLNCTDDSYYQFGIPGLGGLKKTIEYLKELCLELVGENGYITTFGCSMAGYGSLLYGSLLGVDKIIAFSPTCPVYTPREAVINDIKRHSDRYDSVKDIILESPVKKLMIFGGVNPQDYASASQFRTSKNTDISITEGMSHQSVQPLLYKYGVKFLLAKDDLNFFASDIDLSNEIYKEFSTAAINYHYLQQVDDLNAVKQNIISIAKKWKDEIFKSHFFTTLYARILSGINKESPLANLYRHKALVDIRPVTQLSLSLLNDHLMQFDTEFILSYCSRGIERANNMETTSVEDRGKIIGQILKILKPAIDPVQLTEFCKLHNIENPERSAEVNTVSKSINNSDIFATVKVSISNDMPLADIFRETAISYEQVGRIDVAYVLMEQAHNARPEGPYIKRKLDEYRLILSANA